MSENIKVGDLVETCSLMPGVVMKRRDNDIEVRMLHLDGYEGDSYSCHHIQYCGVVKLTAQQALNRLIVGEDKLTKIYSDRENNGTWEQYEELVSKAAKGEINPGPTEILQRTGSLVIIRDRLGRIWLTKRKKLRHDSRRRKPHRGWRSVRYFPIKQLFMSKLPTTKEEMKTELRHAWVAGRLRGADSVDPVETIKTFNFEEWYAKYYLDDTKPIQG